MTLSNKNTGHEPEIGEDEAFDSSDEEFNLEDDVGPKLKISELVDSGQKAAVKSIANQDDDSK